MAKSKKPQDLEEITESVDIEKVRAKLKEMGIECLDDIMEEIAKKEGSFWSFIGTEKSGVFHTVSDVQRRLVDLELMSKELPKGYNPTRKTKRSSYLDPEIVGEKIAKENLKTYITQTYKTLDDLPRNMSLSTQLGVDCNKAPIRKAVADLGLISKYLPEGYDPIGRARRSSYFDAYVVGEDAAMENLKGYVENSYKTLDDIPDNKLIASLLKVNNSRKLIRKAIVEKGWISKDLPKGYSPLRDGHRSSYLDPEVVGEGAVMNNFKEYIASSFDTLDEIPSNVLFASLLNIDNNPKSIRKAIIEKGWMSRELPEGYKPIRHSKRSSYIEQEIVGEEAALDNLKKYISDSFETLDDIPDIKLLASLLNTNHSPNSIRKAIAKFGLFSLNINDYEQNIQQKIINNILNPPARFKSVYINNSLDNKMWRDNFRIVFEELKKREGIRCLDECTPDIKLRYTGFWNSIGVKKIKGKKQGHYFLTNDIKTRLIHLGYFHEDAEQKYSYVKQEGSAVDLLKMIDKELFGYKDLKVDESRVDMVSFQVLKKLNREAQALPAKQRPRNSIDLFEYYHGEYAK